MQKITFSDTTTITRPYVSVDGTNYEVQDGTYQGGTDLNANTFNTMQDNIEKIDIFRNLFNKNDIVNGWLKYSDNTMNDTSSTVFMTTGYIKVKPSTTYIVNLVDSTSLASGGIMQYDSSKTWLGDGIPETQTIIQFTTKSNTQYIRFVLRNNAKDSVQFEENTQTTPYTPYAGYIVESGSNSNGNWIKYSDGTMICYKKISGTVNITTAWGNLYYANVTIGNFAQTFTEIPTINVLGSNEAFFVVVNGSISTSSVDNALLVRPSTLSNMSYVLNVMAIGRWK